MNTVTLWLLIVYGQTAYAGSPTMVVERFADERECERVANVMRTQKYRPTLQCVQATIAVVK